MIKYRSGCPRLFIVTAHATCAELLSMFVEVATEAIARQAEKRATPVEIGALEVLVHKCVTVALATFQLRVATPQREARLRMIESLLTLRPVHQLEIPPRVFAMAGGAALNLTRRHAAVEASPLLDAFLERLVTSEALLPAGPFAHFVALRAVRHAFKLLVRLG